MYNGSTYNGNTGTTDHSVATIWEAGQAEKEGVEIYSIGFGIGNNQNAIKTMKGIASAKTEDHYFSAGMSANDIEAVFNSIARQVSKYVAYNPIVIDTISNDFEYYTDFTLTASAGEGDKITRNGQTVTWDLAAEQLDTTEHTLTFYVKYKNLDNPAAPNTNLPTNDGAQLKYAKEENGQATETQNIANASVLSLSKTVSYEVTGTAPKGYMKPGDAHVWVGHEYTVADVHETVNAEEGTYTFEGWKANGKTVSGKLPITADITLTGEWKFEAAPTTKTITITKVWDKDVTDAQKQPVVITLYQRVGMGTVNPETDYYDSITLDGTETAPWTGVFKDLPLKNDKDEKYGYAVVETRIGTLQVTNGSANVIRMNEDGESAYTVGTWFVNSSRTPAEPNTYYITNTYTSKPQYTLDYQFVGTNKPDDVTSAPDAVTGLYAGQRITLADPTTEETGWIFNGWYSTEECNESDKVGTPGSTYEVKGNATLYGKWTYTKPTPDPINITVTKVWVNADGKYDKKPVEIELYKGGVATGTTLTLNGRENPAWTGKFENLTDDGTYTVKETKIGGWSFGADNKATIDHVSTYRYEVTGNAENGFTVTNTLEKRTWSVTKTVDKTACKVGDMLTYTITVMNDGNVALNNIDVRESFGGKGKLYWDANRENEVTLGEKNSLGTIETLKTGDSETYILYYWVEEADGESVTNTVLTAIDEVYSNSTVTTDVDRGDVDGYEVHGWITKNLESKKGTFKQDETFKFNIWADEDCTDWLGEGSVVFNKTVKEGESYWIGDDFSFQISENNFKKLKEIDGHEVIYVTERKGDIKGMTYDSDVVTMYLVHNEASAYSLNIGENDHYYATADLSYDNPQPAEFTNVYKKPADKGETIKSGPQLNRDDHVAYIMGYPDGTVQPEGQITRAEACTIFFRLLTDSSRDYYFARTNDYSDVNRGDWFNNAISTLSNAGIVTGYNDGTFRPNQPITRGEMAKIIANFANLKSGGKTFTDLAGHWSKSYVELAAGNGWIAGYPDGSFRPDQKITRAETVTMINRVLDRVPAKESRLLSRSIMLTFPDNKPGDWYYIAIQEASNSHEYQRSVYETTGDEMWTKLIDNVDWTKLEK